MTKVLYLFGLWDDLDYILPLNDPHMEQKNSSCLEKKKL